MTKLDRRTFLRSSALASGSLFGLQGLVARGATAAPRYGHGLAQKGDGGYGPLYPTVAQNYDPSLPLPINARFLSGTPGTYLALPEGFSYTVFGMTGTLMSDGLPTPPAHDGMAAFVVDGKIRLVRNHEVRTQISPSSKAFGDPSKAYDTLSGGGTTTLIVDPATRRLERAFASLSGTEVNCAGGPTPWGSWLSCEETVAGIAQGFTRDHGYIFEVWASTDGQVSAVPLKAMGRFVHEAVAIDPATSIVYETEDRNPAAGFYRFLPNQPGKLGAGGRLQMLAIKDRPNYDTRTNQQLGKPLLVTWVDIANPDPASTDGFAAGDGLAVYKQGYDQRAATFSRLEGCWYGNGSIFLNSTNGGDAGLGQVWQYRPSESSGDQLILLFESPSADVLDAPDNICVSPRGGLALCEDGDSAQYVRGLTQTGKIFDLAQNMVYVGARANEFAGATFSPAGETLFVNIQTPGMTFAIWGTWQVGAL